MLDNLDEMGQPITQRENRLKKALEKVRRSEYTAEAECVIKPSFLEGKIRLELCDEQREVFFADSGHCDTIGEAIESMLRDFESNPDFN
jgi:hypothetical protein